jgi:hypothetical protein
MSDTFIINAGSDLEAQLTWPNGSGGAANLTGYTVSAIDIEPNLAPHLTVEFISAPAGTIRIRVDWSDSLPLGRVMYFRILLVSASGERTSTNLIWLDVR